MNIDEEVGKAILEMRDLLLLLAEPKIAERDQKKRDEIRKIAGTSEKKRKTILLMDGSRTQAAIHKATSFHAGDLSALVKQFAQADLLVGDSKQPRLAISLPPTFFDKEKV